MKKLIVSAAASPLFGNFLMLVSVSAETDGRPVKKLKPKDFSIHHLASLNHAYPSEREVAKATEGPNGFYTLLLKPSKYQPKLPPGHYVFAVAVKKLYPVITQLGKPAPKPSKYDFGQTIAVGDLPKYGQW